MRFTPNKVTEDFSSAPQIVPEGVARIAAMGFKTIMNCRPDGEGGAEQPTSAQLQALAEQHGLMYFHFPVAMGTAGEEFVTQVSGILASTPKPVLGFCRSGTRATRLYQSASGAVGKNTLMQWLKSKCLITRLWTWRKNKQCATLCSK